MRGLAYRQSPPVPAARRGPGAPAAGPEHPAQAQRTRRGPSAPGAGPGRPRSGYFAAPAAGGFTWPPSSAAWTKSAR